MSRRSLLAGTSPLDDMVDLARRDAGSARSRVTQNGRPVAVRGAVRWLFSLASRREVVGFRNCTSLFIGEHMLRRKFITLFGGAAAIWPLAASAQQPTVPVIGFLSGATFETMREYVVAFHRGLADAGFVEGRNLAVEYRWAEGHNDRLPALATDLVRRGVAIIVRG